MELELIKKPIQTCAHSPLIGLHSCRYLCQTSVHALQTGYLTPSMWSKPRHHKCKPTPVRGRIQKQGTVTDCGTALLWRAVPLRELHSHCIQEYIMFLRQASVGNIAYVASTYQHGLWSGSLQRGSVGILECCSFASMRDCQLQAC